MPRKLTYEFVKSQFEKRGYTLLSSEYKSATDKLEYICPKGHRGSIQWNNFQHGQGCWFCNGKIKKTIDEVREAFEKEGYILISDVYKNAHQKLHVICSNNHDYYVTWNAFQQGSRCPECSGVKKKTIEYVREFFAKEGYLLISNTYKSAHSKLVYKCPNGHIGSTCYSDFSKGHRCNQCYLENKGGENHWNWKGGVTKLDIPLYDTYADQLSWCEEVRRNPDNREYLQVRCTESGCRKWFTPTATQVFARIRVLNGKSKGEARFYCSDACKKKCSIFGQHLYPKGFKHYSTREVQPELRRLVLERDGYECQRCGAKDKLEVHHYESIYQNPVESADRDNCITLCHKCHKKAHTDSGCRYNDLKPSNLCR